MAWTHNLIESNVDVLILSYEACVYIRILVLLGSGSQVGDKPSRPPCFPASQFFDYGHWI